MIELRRELGLAVSWSTHLQPWPSAPPLRMGERVVVRQENTVCSLSPEAGGEVLWSREVVREPSAGLLAVGRDRIAINHGLEERSTRLYVLDVNGDTCATPLTEGYCLRRGLWFEGDTLRVLLQAPEGRVVRDFDAGTGEMTSEYFTPEVATDAVIRHPSGDLLLSYSGAPDAAGLFIRTATTGQIERVREGRVWRHAMAGSVLLVTIGADESSCRIEALDSLELHHLWSVDGVGSPVDAGRPGVACFQVTDEERPAIVDPESARIRWTGEASRSRAIDVRFAGPLLLVGERSRRLLYDLRSGELLGERSGISRDCAVFARELVFGLDDEVVALAVPD